MAEPATARAFLALEVGVRLRAALAELLEGTLAEWPGLKRVRPEGLHVTLRFLGQVRTDPIHQIAAALRVPAARCVTREAASTGLGVFPARGAPRVLWVGLEPSADVLDLQAACERAAQAAGFAPERRPFAAHVTLGRWREHAHAHPHPHAPAPRLPRVQLPPAHFEDLVLFRSELGPGGARYTPLHRLPLAAVPPPRD